MKRNRKAVIAKLGEDWNVWIPPRGGEDWTGHHPTKPYGDNFCSSFDDAVALVGQVMRLEAPG